MPDYVERAGLQVDRQLADFIESGALAGLDMDTDTFWRGAADIFARLTPENRKLLSKRDSMQAAIDDWHRRRAGQPIDQGEYRAFLRELGYLEPEPEPFEIDTANVDPEVAQIAGPQLVVPVLNDRFLLNAANARWGSIYDALYGTDALPGEAKPGEYDAERGTQVIAAARELLDQIVPLASGSWADFDGGMPALADPLQLVGRRGGSLLLRHNGLHLEVVVDRAHPIGKSDPAGIADVLIESALTTIVDFEDSVTAVDGADKVTGYRNWLGLMRGDLEARFEKGGEQRTRSLEPDREYEPVSPERVEGRLVSENRASTSSALTENLELPGRSLLFCRNVGHLMTTPALLLADGSEAPEGILDAIVTSLIALHDLRGLGRYRNSHAGSVYIVKPKMHGSAEAAFANRLFDAVEDMLGLDRHTLKIGLMDEERRTSANLAACIHALRHRIVFINTGFLDRTGDEIHTSMEAGPMLRKAAIKQADWLEAYEDRNVRIGLACGFSGRAQIGKGMWPAPDRMAEMMEAKIAHPRSGANTAWVPSPTAATLHAIHYHKVDVFERQRAIAAQAIPPLEKLLTIPLADGKNWSSDEIREELDNNAQGILGYVVRWIDFGVGCSKVPDIHDVGLMEDRATLRISSQHIANWLRHGVCSEQDVDAAFARMAAKVDAQNAGDPLYGPMAGNADSLALQAARALVFEGAEQPNGYTEPLLHEFRQRAKAL